MDRQEARISDGSRRFKLSCIKGINTPSIRLRPMNANTAINPIGALTSANRDPTPISTINRNIRRSLLPRYFFTVAENFAKREDVAEKMAKK